MSRRSKVVMLAGDGLSTRVLFHALNRTVGVEKVILEEPVPATELLRRRSKKLGLRKTAGQLLFRVLVDEPLRRTSRKRVREIVREAGLVDDEVPEDAIVRIPSVNARASLDALEELQPDVIVVNGTRIISERVLDAVRVPFLNMHAGVTPLYRGVHGGYWAIVNGERDRCGVTVHLVDRGIDTGGILAQARISPTSRDNFATYGALQLVAGVPLMIAAVEAARSGELRVLPPPEGASRLWSHPTFGEYLEARLKHGIR